ncbi:MAG: ABC transporter substrate-binding protein [Candidatus Omnitrophica bacterium]|nr:ABC transporter substrate-binding protein [Candidatus Omnitrophota bacterium]MCF7876969.1 ABC transporter substrate-binding protein [Candidatus Omnitrophota bacterium]MCF7878684.1 ABC transporter substrate-binding protein [Candidatus Omnitrophota bacterium]MCF7893048.1 ABC transporter substrate-binding protein [Candidatus Omnitrophota bacterium]
MSKNKKNIILIFIILILALFIFYALGGFFNKAKNTTDKVVIACYRGEPAALVYLAKQEGLFRDNGIEAVIKDYQAGQFAMNALLSHQADIAIVSDSTLVSNSFKHKDLKIFAVIAESRARKLVVRRGQGIEEAKDLIGKTIRLVKKSADEYYLGKFLSLHNINLSQINMVNSSPSQTADSLVSAAAAAGIIRGQEICRVEKAVSGQAIVWGLQTYNPFYFLLATKTKWLNDNPECASKIIKSLVEAERIITHDKGRLRTFFQEKFSYQNDCLKQAVARNSYYVYLPQALLFEFENQAFWRIKNNLTKSKKIPNYLNFIYPYALKVIDSQRVNVIR